MKKRIIKHNKNKRITILVFFIFISLFIETKTLNAQSYTTTGSYSTNGYSTTLGGIGSYLEVVSPALKQLPLCKEKLMSKTTKNLFQANIPDVGNLIAQEQAQREVSLMLDDLGDSSAIPTEDKETLKEIKNVKKDTEATKKSIQSFDENDTCIKSIGRMVGKILLQKITASTVEWINNGYEGKPFFLEDPKKFFGDIAKYEILSFKLEIDDPKNYPFGRNYLQNMVKKLDKRFADNARYSMNELIKETTPEYTSTTFSADFGKGGWNAWDAMTQVPANNPIGFNIISSNELSQRLEGTSKNTAQERQEVLDQAGGFLGQEICDDPEGITKSEDLVARKKGEKEYATSFIDNNSNGIPDVDDINNSKKLGIDLVIPKPADGKNIMGYADPTGYIIGTCKKWKYVTPGKMISEYALKQAHYVDNNLLRTEDLNDAIAAIMDAVLNSMIPKIQNEGYSSYSMSGNYEVDGTQGTNGMYSQVEIDFPESMRNTDWLEAHYNFNIRTDLTQAIIDEQRTYQKKLKEENQVLEDLITTVYQLDYCIPGPHPGFENDSREILDKVINAIPNKNAQDFIASRILNDEGGMRENMYVPSGVSDMISQAVGSLIAGQISSNLGDIPFVGEIFSGIFDLFVSSVTCDEYELVDAFYSKIFFSLTGVRTNGDNMCNNSASLLNTNKVDRAYLTGKDDIASPLNVMLTEYIKIIKKYYNRETLPPVASNAATEFKRISGYKEIIEQNNNAIITMEETIKRLAVIKEELDAMSPETNTHSEYLPYINEFARISENMVTGDSVQKVVNETNKSISKIRYVYEDLLIGKFGCEQQMGAISGETGLSANDHAIDDRLLRTIRVKYPIKVWYEYDLSGGYSYPVPNELVKYLNKATVPNKEPSIKKDFGPGFLSTVYWETEKDKGSACDTNDWYLLDCINIKNLFYNIESQGNGTRVGETKNTDSRQKSFFEKIIGVY